jgi:hypothetical protein
MGNGAAQKCGMQHVGEVEIVNKQRPAPQQFRVFVPLDGSTEVSRRHVVEKP